MGEIKFKVLLRNFASVVAAEKGYKKAKNYFGSTNDWSEIDSNVEKY